MVTAKKKKLSIEKIIIILCSIPLILLAVGFFYVLSLKDVLYTSVRDSMQEVGARTAEMAFERLQTTSVRMLSVSYLNDITSKNIKLNDKLDVLRTEMQRHGWKDMFFADLNGFGTTVSGASFSIANRKYFHEVLKGKTRISNIINREGYDKDYVIHAVPVISHNKEIIGVLVGVEDAFATHFSQIKRENDALGAEIYFVDGNGYFVENGKVSKKTIYEKIAEENNFNDKKVDKHFLDLLCKEGVPILFRGVESYISVDPLGDTRWSVVSIVSRDASMRQVDTMWFFSIGLIAAIFVTLIFCIMYLLKMKKVHLQYKIFSNAVVNAKGIFYLYIDDLGFVHFANSYFYAHLEHDENGEMPQILNYMDDLDAHGLKNLLHSGQNFTLHIHPKYGNPFHMQCSVLPHDDRKDLWILLGTDISASQNSLEAKLVEDRTAELQQIINSIPHSFLVHSKDGVRFANKAALEILGVDTSESVREGILRGMSLQEYTRQVAIVKNVISNGATESSVFEFKAANGDELIFRNIQSPVYDVDGKVKYAINISIDITETINLQNKLEDELRRQREILDSSPTGFLYTCERTIVYCNPAIQKMTGVEMGKTVPYEHIDMLGVGLDYRDQVEKGKAVNDVLAVVPGENGQKRYLRISALGTNWFGKWHSMVWAHDVTDIHNVQNELVLAKEAAEQAARAKSDFLATMSHEIRTPMNAVLGFLHVFEKGNLNTTQLDYINKITISAKGLLRIINDILDFSKIEANKMDLERAPFNIIANIDAVYSIMSFSAQEKMLTFQKSLDDDVPRMLLGDGERLNQVLLNLLSNAIKFTVEGTVALHVAVEEKINFQEYVLRFDVSDTGIGLSEEQISILFKPFTQADTSTSRKFGGTGLGLAISKRLVELMGGTITLKSEAGKGSTFTCLIPMQLPLESLVPYGREGEIEITTEDIALQLDKIKGKKILVAEDNLINQEIAAAMLEEFEFNLDFADNGQEAVEKVQKNRYDLIFMDLQMPILNGLDATRAIRKLGKEGGENDYLKNIPIIAMTANVMSEDRKSCQEAGMDDHVGKPISPEALRTALLTWLVDR